MPFWTYMLHCRGGTFYTGHTDNLDRRVNEHMSGDVPGFTHDRLPVELVWSEEFLTRHEALAAEQQIKGWSRAKKLALIRGDWEEISDLAKSKDSPSTSSGRTEVLEGTIASHARLDKALAEATELSRARIQGLIADGQVSIGGSLVTSAKAKVQASDAFTVHVPAAVEAEACPQDIPLDVVFEDIHLIVVNKPAGMVVHPAAGNPDGTLVNALLHHCNNGEGGGLSGIGGVARPGIVHRIDKDTSGLLVVAKSDAAHEGLARQFADHSIERRYWALCNGHPRPSQGRIEGKIGRSDANRKKMAVLDAQSSRGKHAVTHYKTEKLLNHCALIECKLETGRTHQVRVHCASIGHALLGDPVYGRTPAQLRPILKGLSFNRQALHAASLGFEHPITGETHQFEAELPLDMRELIDETTR